MLKFQNEKETKNASVLGINIYETKTGKMYLNLTEGEAEEEEPDRELELGEGRVVGGPGEHEVPHGVAVVREAEQRGPHQVHAVRQLAQVQQDDRLAVRARTLQRARPGGRSSSL